MTTDHEAKAREILDGEMDPRQGEPFAAFRAREARIRSAIASALREAEAGEREACAKIVDTHKTKHRNYAYDIDSRPSSDYAEATRLARECEAIAAAIREKGE